MASYDWKDRPFKGCGGEAGLISRKSGQDDENARSRLVALDEASAISALGDYSRSEQLVNGKLSEVSDADLQNLVFEIERTPAKSNGLLTLREDPLCLVSSYCTWDTLETIPHI